MDDLLRLLDEVGSTNDEALALGRGGAAHGTAVAARAQTAGRGRRGHVWESPQGNLYLSVVLRPDVTPARLPGLAAACGLGVVDGLGRLRLADGVRLKWPNDLLACGGKLAGILVEVARDEEGSPFAVCGVGVNMRRAPRGLGASCLEDVAPGLVPSVGELAESLRSSISERVLAWATKGEERPLDGILDDYLVLLAWRGERVRALAPDGSELARGTLEGVDAWGRALVGDRPWTAEQASLRLE